MKNKLFLRGWKPTLLQFKQRFEVCKVLAIKILIWDIMVKFCYSQNLANIIFQRYHQEIERYLESKGYLDELLENLNSQFTNESSEDNPIWVCWWQGESAMPDIVKTCYNRIKAFSNGHPVHLITIDNVNQYVEISENVMSLFKQKKLKPAHLADLLRLKLLDKYGGLWLDATIFLSKPLDDSIFNHSLYSLCVIGSDFQSVSNYRWCSFVLGAKQHNPLIHSLSRTFEDYIVNERVFIHYLVIDYFIDMLYKNSNMVKSTIDGFPSGGSYLHTLRDRFADKYDDTLFKDMQNTCTFFKLTYKENIVLYTKKGEETFYSHIIKS